MSSTKLLSLSSVFCTLIEHIFNQLNTINNSLPSAAKYLPL